MVRERRDSRMLEVCFFGVGGVVEVRPADFREAQARDRRINGDRIKEEATTLSDRVEIERPSLAVSEGLYS